jgi:BASS family bile acid:Na+ symporter
MSIHNFEKITISNSMLKILKGYMMPIAMILGVLFYPFFGALNFLTPYLIFLMLFLTYSKLKFSEIKFSRLHIWLVSIQVLGCLGVYLLVYPFNPTVAQGIMICVLAPTATAAPVITGMLKGNVASVTANSLISNISVAIMAPIIFSFVGTNQALPFFDSFTGILKPMFVLLLLPLLLALLLRKISPRLIHKIGTFSGFSFYLWSVSLMIVTGRTVGFVMEQTGGNHTPEILIAAGALLVCVSQFLVGRKIGSHYDNTIAGGQGLGQKNTILAIWMAQTYLNPIASIGPGSYVLWQNIVNSYQVWLKRKSL